jgi:hypothetical protein
VDVIAFAIGLQQLRAKVATDLKPSRADRVEHALGDDAAAVLRREYKMCIQAVDDMRADAEVFRCAHAANVARL